MQQLALSTVALGQGVPFWHAGSDMLRSKSLDRNSYNSGDHFNELDFSYQSNGFGVGLPPAPDNQPKWQYMTPLLEDPALKPAPADIRASVDRFRDLLRVAQSSPLFSLTTAEQVQQKLSYLDGSAVPGLIVQHLDDTVGADVDPAHERIVVALNATDEAQTFTAAQLAGKGLVLHPVQAAGADPVVKGARFDRATGALVVPARTTAVFVERSAPPALEVDVEVRAADRVVNPNGRGSIVFTVLSTRDFDPVATLDDGTLRFGRTGTEDSIVRCTAVRDQNRDRVRDLSCTARVDATGIRTGDTSLRLTGATTAGLPVTGEAAVRTTAPRR
jgi:hypothetical protein